MIGRRLGGGGVPCGRGLPMGLRRGGAFKSVVVDDLAFLISEKSPVVAVRSMSGKLRAATQTSSDRQT